MQTGFGRTGKMFACEHYGLEPDIVTMAKSLGGGLPLSAVTGRADVMDSAQVGGLGGTYAGNPVACAAALAAVDFIEKNRLPERAAAIGRVVEQRFHAFVERFPFVGDARGLGAMRALELVKDKAGKEPDKDRTDRVIKAAYEAGLAPRGSRDLRQHHSHPHAARHHRRRARRGAGRPRTCARKGLGATSSASEIPSRSNESGPATALPTTQWGTTWPRRNSRPVRGRE